MLEEVFLAGGGPEDAFDGPGVEGDAGGPVVAADPGHEVGDGLRGDVAFEVVVQQYGEQRRVQQTVAAPVLVRHRLAELLRSVDVAGRERLELFALDGPDVRHTSSDRAFPPVEQSRRP